MFKLTVAAGLTTLLLSGCAPEGPAAENEVSLTPAPQVEVKKEAPTQDYVNFQKNLALLATVNSALKAQGLPLSPKLVPLTVAVPNIAELAGLKNVKTSGKIGRILYRSTGTDYKLVLFNNGQCYLARKHAPELVDPRRSYGEVDCTSFGYWTEGAVKY